MSDPRVFFAAERTLLAWVRTGLTVIALGFVIARFGLFLNLIARQGAAPHAAANPSPLPTLIGVLLVVGGTVTMFIAALQHRSFLKTLDRQEIPPQYGTSPAFLLAFALASLGAVIAAYLVTSIV